MTAGYVEFEFNLPEALLAKLVQVFNALSPAPLDLPALEHIPNEQGVYQLFLDRGGATELVYIGKTDADTGLCGRLTNHFWKVQHRRNLDPSAVQFKAVRIYVFTAIDLEAQLIEHYGGKVSWNGSGFGAKDPGEKRDTTYYKAKHFDAQFPIDIDRPLSFSLQPSGTAAAILKTLKKELPYLLRFQVISQGSRTGHADLETTKVNLNSSLPMTPRSVLEQVIGQLPPNWHATMLPSHIIIYKNDARTFPSGMLIARS